MHKCNKELNLTWKCCQQIKAFGNPRLDSMLTGYHSNIWLKAKSPDSRNNPSLRKHKISHKSIYSPKQGTQNKTNTTV